MIPHDTHWLLFMDTYRTFCVSPSVEMRKLFEGVQTLQLAA